MVRRVFGSFLLFATSDRLIDARSTAKVIATTEDLREVIVEAGMAFLKSDDGVSVQDFSLWGSHTNVEASSASAHTGLTLPDRSLGPGSTSNSQSVSLMPDAYTR